MTVQLENGYLKIANELLESLIQMGLSSQQFRIVLLVIRKTYGYDKKSAPISNTTMIQMSGMTKSRISQVINQLIDLNIITLISDEPGKIREYQINKDYKTWKGYHFIDTVKKNDTYQKNDSKGITLAIEGYHFSDSFVDQPKYNIKYNKKQCIVHFEKFWQKYPKKQSKKKAQEAFIKLHPTQDLLDKMLTAIDNQKKSNQWQNPKYIPLPTTWLNQERWNDEVNEATSQPNDTLGFSV